MIHLRFICTSIHNWDKNLIGKKAPLDCLLLYIEQSGSHASLYIIIKFVTVMTDEVYLWYKSSLCFAIFGGIHINTSHTLYYI